MARLLQNKQSQTVATLQQRKLSSLSYFWLALSTFLVWANPTRADEPILKRFPDREGITIWSDDFPQLLRQFETLFEFSQEEIEELSKVEPFENAPSYMATHYDAVRKRTPRQLAQLNKVWKTLREGAIFNGQALLFVPLNTYEEQPDQSSVIVAQVTQDQQALESFTDELRKLMQVEDEPLKEVQLPGVWKIEDGWFCWSPDETTAEEVLDLYAGRAQARSSLFDSRRFQTAMRNLDSETSRKSVASFYISEKAIPLLLAFASLAMPSLEEFSPLDDQAQYFLNEIRGFGGRIYVGDRELLENLDAPFSLDAFMVLAQPRRGVLRFLDQKSEAAIDLDYRSIDLPLLSLAQFAFDGEELFAGVRDIYQRSAAFAGSPDDWRDEFESDSDANAFRQISQYADQQYLLTEASPNQTHYRSLSTIIVKPANMEEYSAYLLEGTSGEARRPLSTYPPPFDTLGDLNGFGWGYSKEQIQKNKARVNSQIQRLQQELDEFESQKQKSDETASRIEEVKRMLSLSISFVGQFKERPPSFVEIQDWLYYFLDDDIPPHALLGLRQRHPQIIRLEESIDGLRSAFGIEQRPVGVVAFWPAEAARLLEPVVPPIYGDFSYPTATTLRTQRLSQKVCGRFESFMTIMTNDDDGIRITAAALRHSEEKEDEVDRQ